MTTLIVKEGVVVYTDAELTATGTFYKGFFDPTTRSDNSIKVEVESLPEGFEIGQYTWDGSKLSPNTSYLAELSVDDVESKPTITSIASAKIAEIDATTSAAIQAGFEYVIDGVSYHFSYDALDQQNFSDSANVANLIKSGVVGLPESTPWNAYKNWTPENGGELVQLTFGVESFIQFYTSGALTHKAACMASGIARKNAVKAALAAKATAAEIQAI